MAACHSFRPNSEPWLIQYIKVVRPKWLGIFRSASTTVPLRQLLCTNVTLACQCYSSFVTKYSTWRDYDDHSKKLGILALLGQVSYPWSFPRTRVHDRVARSMHRAPWSSHYMFTGRIRYFSLHYEPGRVIYEVQYFYLTHQNVFERSFVHFIKTYMMISFYGLII